MKTKLLKEFKSSCKSEGIQVKKVKYINSLYLECEYNGRKYDISVERNVFRLMPQECQSEVIEILRKKIA